MILAVPIAYTLWNRMDILAAVFAVFASVLDIADGIIARKYKLITELGKILDPLADKLLIGIIIIILLIQGRFPLWFAAAFLVRDTLIVLGGIYAKKKTGYVLPSNWPGKIAAILTGITVLGYILSIAFIENYVIWIAFAFMLLSFSMYLYRFIRHMESSE
ncbi:MAG: CDP-alcohol phosphatidyltransferase family protein [Bacteroidota bacterium]